MPIGMNTSEYDVLCAKPGMSSYSRSLRAFTVPVSSVLVPLRGIAIAPAGADAAKFRSKVSLQASGAVDDFYGQELGVPTSVLSLFYFALDNATGINGTANSTDVPSPVVLQLRQGSSWAMNVRFTGTLSAVSFADRDLLLQKSGLLGTQWEIWGRVPAGFPVRFATAVTLSDLCDKHDGTILGPNYVASLP